jgi:hypothetical protein
MEGVSIAHNQKYLHQWSELLTKSPFKGYYRHLVRKYESKFSEHGYSLMDGLTGERVAIMNGGPLSDVLGDLGCRSADAYAFMWRAVKQTKWAFKRQARQLAPKSLLARVK